MHGHYCLLSEGQLVTECWESMTPLYPKWPWLYALEDGKGRQPIHERPEW